MLPAHPIRRAVREEILRQGTNPRAASAGDSAGCALAIAAGDNREEEKGRLTQLPQ
jgi:hypothetical protein